MDAPHPVNQPRHLPQVNGDDEAARQKYLQFFRAAEPLFVRFGFRKTTVEEICRDAGASKRTFYELFRDKTDLFARLAIYLADVMVNDWYERAAGVENPVELVHLYLDVYLKAINEHPVFRRILEEPQVIQGFGEYTKQVELSAVVKTFGDIVRYGQAKDVFRPMSADAITWIVHSLLDGLFLIGSDMHPHEDIVHSELFEREVRAFILHGLGAH